MNPIDRTEKIDEYLQGRMSDDEKREFERLLSDDSKSLESEQLKDEMQKQKEIIMAIQACGLKEQLQSVEVDLKAKKEKSRAKRKKLLKTLTISGGTIGGLFVVAAAVMLLVVMPMSKSLVDVSEKYAHNIDLGQTRGDAYCLEEELYSQLLQAFLFMGEGRWRRADNIVFYVREQSENCKCYDIYNLACDLSLLCELNSYRLRCHYYRYRIDSSDDIDKDLFAVYTLIGNEQWDEAEEALEGIESEAMSDTIYASSVIYSMHHYLCRMKDINRWLQYDCYFENYDVHSRLIQAYMLVNREEWRYADAISMQLVEETKQSDDEETQEIYDQTLWLHTVCVMHDGDLLESIKLLRQIADSDSRFAEQAQEILDDLL